MQAATTSSSGGFRSARFLAASTGLRIVLMPVVMALLMADGAQPGGVSIAAAALFCVAAATDWLDGRLARRWGVTTKLGSFLDTTADKLLVTGVLIALVAVERASPWVAMIIVARELAILGLRAVVAADGTVIQPSPLARWKTTVQFVAIAVAIVRPGDRLGGLYADEWLMLAAAVITVASAADYFARFAAALEDRG